MSFTTVTNVKTVLRIPAAITTHDAVLALIVDGVNEGVLSHTGADALTTNTYTETYNVDYSTNELALKHRPVQSMVALWLFQKF